MRVRQNKKKNCLACYSTVNHHTSIWETFQWEKHREFQWKLISRNGLFSASVCWPLFRSFAACNCSSFFCEFYRLFFCKLFLCVFCSSQGNKWRQSNGSHSPNRLHTQSAMSDIDSGSACGLDEEPESGGGCADEWITIVL